MAFKNQLLLLVFLLSLFRSHFGLAQNIQGGYWFPGSGISASDIDSTLFTHLLCAFAHLDRTTYQVVIPSSNTPYFSSFTQIVQRKNPSVKTLLSIGGGKSNPEDFATMASQASSRKTFIDSSIQLARSNGFHGLDLDWETPNTIEKMTNFGLLLNEWRAAVAAEATSSSSTVLLLSAAVYYSSHHRPADYPVSDIANSLDWINLMAYDFYAPGWTRPLIAGPHAALYNPGNKVSGDNGVTAWIGSGMPANKLVLGFPFFGYAWQLTDANNHGLFASASGAAISRDGSMVYKKIKKFVSDNGATTAYNSTVVSDYCYLGRTLICYDDTQSISTKVSYAKGKGLLGYYAWHLGGDENWVLSEQAARSWAA